MILKTSNKSKMAEFKRILGDKLVIEPGIDLPEVDGNKDEVIIYKSLEAGKNIIVEDTILLLDGKEVVDIKWNQEDKLKNTKVATWITSIGYNDGEQIHVYRGIINGIVVEPKVPGFAFDPYFLPDGSDLTLSELDKVGRKEEFSARKIALINLVKNRSEFSIDISKIKPWTGKYQNEKKTKTVKTVKKNNVLKK